MKKISTVAIERMQIFRENQLKIGLGLGDRTSHYSILDEAGEVILGQALPTIAKGIEQVFSKIPRSRIVLETGTHSPWISRQLSQFGHEVMVAPRAQRATDRREQPERRSAGCQDLPTQRHYFRFGHSGPGICRD